MRLRREGPRGLRGVRRARLYQTLRTAHLEQALLLSPASIIYRSKRYDFDEVLAARLNLTQAGPVAAALMLARSTVAEMEINEPLMRYAIRGSALAVGALRLRGRLGGPKAMIVTYAIENLNPFGPEGKASAKRKLSSIVDTFLTRFVWGQVDRIVFGTPASRELYREALGPLRAGAEEHNILTLPELCSCSRAQVDDDRVIFLGAFSARKGFPLLVEAWPKVLECRPSARLTILGKGPLEDAARSVAQRHSSVELIIDPSREEIHRQLRRATLLALPSQPMPSWKEQLGLPITEALAHGCAIVTTSETGLSEWLAKEGHAVVVPDSDPAALAHTIATMLRIHPSRQDVLDSLPIRDGRLAADDWMFRFPYTSRTP